MKLDSMKNVLILSFIVSLITFLIVQIIKSYLDVSFYVFGVVVNSFSMMFFTVLALIGVTTIRKNKQILVKDALLVFTLLLIPALINTGTIYGLNLNIMHRDVAVSDDIKVFLHKDVYKIMDMLWTVDEKEYHVCMFGNITNNTYYIDEVLPSLSYKSTNTSIKHKKCDTDALISLHKHPKDEIFYYCYPSDTDIFSHRIDTKIINKNILLGIQCDDNLFYFFDKNNYDYALSWGVYGE